MVVEQLSELNRQPKLASHELDPVMKGEQVSLIA